MHFYENGGNATCRLHWSYLGQGDQVESTLSIRRTMTDENDSDEILTQGK
jgi:hypothetical protein